MKFKRFNKNNSILLIVGVLFISLCINVYISVMNSNYVILAGRGAYSNVEDIRNRNQGALTILDQSIEAGSITNEELLTLYKNYNSISDSFIDLWSKYRTYGQGSIISVTKKLDKAEENPNEVYMRIESLMFEYLKLEMKNHNEKIILDGKILNDFNTMRSMAVDVDKFYTKFIEDNLKDISEEEKQEKIIRKEYWIDILKGINQSIEPYINYEFSI
ncbi:hypothetical protein JCM1393_05620 [Clostridium carnis]